MDYGKIIPAKLSREDVRDAAETFRNTYISDKSIPVNIENVMQSALELDPLPIEDLQHDCNIDGFISLDFKYIYIDKYMYMSESYYRRVRFTFAHEIGHRELHRSNIESLKFESIDQWIKFRIAMREDDLGWFEWQASEFAGRLLVPIDSLITEFKSARNEVQRRNISWDAPSIDNEELFSLVAPLIAPKFDVSADVIEKRLTREQITKFIL